MSKRTIPLCVAAAALCSCAEPQIDCATDVVKSTLASIVRGRVVQVVADGLPASLAPARRTRLSKASLIAVRDPRLIEWEKGDGRLKCVATVLVDARQDDRGAYVTAQTELAYRVVRSDDDTVLVEVAYADLMNIFSMPAANTP